jgi:hypothetical protein
VNGDYELFVKIGLVIGEAIKAGFMDVAGNLIVDSIRGYTGALGGATGARGEAAAGILGNAVLGPKASIGDRAADIATQLRPLIDDVKAERDKTNPELIGGNTQQQMQELKRVRVAVEEQLKGSKLTRQERVLLFSR